MTPGYSPCSNKSNASRLRINCRENEIRLCTDWYRVGWCWRCHHSQAVFLWSLAVWK